MKRIVRSASLLVLAAYALLVAPPTAPARGFAQAAPIDCSGVLPAGSPVAATPAAAGAGPIAFPAGGGDLTIFAASSLTDAFTEMEATLEAANPGLQITLNFAGSAALVTQLSEGAPADVVALASEGQMKSAAAAGVIEGTASVFARNRLAIVVPSDNPAGIETAAGLTKDGVKLVLAAAEVPAGQYARESICLMATDPATYGEDFAERAGATIVSEEDNVKAVLAKVRLGEADAGIVYVTDVTAQVVDEVRIIEIPDAVNVAASYPVAAVAGGQTELAAAFIGYVLGEEGQAVLVRHGFVATP